VYKIDDQLNTISQVDTKTFKELGYGERSHVQEWIAKNPSVFGEDLLIIQKEFAGFTDTKERLDLLALDKNGNLVVIENKLDDSGKDVVWQALKYASYCSQLTKTNIKELYQEYLETNGSTANSDEEITDFLEAQDFDEVQLNLGNSQRVIMVAAHFRKEITSTVLWLMNYRLKVQCFKITPYVVGGDRYINFEQIIPVKDVEDYMITMADKAHSESMAQDHENENSRIRREFWTNFLASVNDTVDLYKNITPTDSSGLHGSIGATGIGLNCVIAKTKSRVEIYISRPSAQENKYIFDRLRDQKDEIEESIGQPLEWARLDHRKACRICLRQNDKTYLNQEDWSDIIEFFIKHVVRFQAAFQQRLNDAKATLPDVTVMDGSQ